MNKITRNFTIENYNNLIASFENTKEIFWDKENKKLIHPGEYGSYREELIKKWLRMYVPERFDISSGFIINSGGFISTQCDIIIYDKLVTPKIEIIDNQKFFPIETVSCVGEIKSDINSIAELNGYLKKLSEIKKARENVRDATPYYPNNKIDLVRFLPLLDPFDNIFTFLMCNRFNFDIKPEEINYGDIEQRFKHNLVLSLQNGMLSYKINSDSKVAISMPFCGDNNHIDNFYGNDDNELPKPIIGFLSSLQMALNRNSLLSIDMLLYIAEDKNIADKIK
jgi:hypothetical protein